MRTSTSQHHLNGDRPLSLAGKIEYLLRNRVNNARPYSGVDPRLRVRPFECPASSIRWSDLTPLASPSRTLSDLFWRTLPWAAIQETLGEIRILDVGCGSGHYGPQLLSWSNGAIARYAGTDAQPHARWAELAASDARLQFYQAKAEDFRRTIPPGTNMFISQSAIEHFDEDLTFFRQIRDYVNTNSGPVVQVHLAPSQACLRLYLLHGVRQYTPRTMSSISRLFTDDGYATLYGLGGAACNRLHFDFITKPVLLRGTDLRTARSDEYNLRLRQAVDDDLKVHQRSPAFWALAIQSRGRTRIFN